MRKAKVVNGKYKGRIGKAVETKKVGNIMFYPKEGIHPYVVCLKSENIEFLDEDDKKGLTNN